MNPHLGNPYRPDLAKGTHEASARALKVERLARFIWDRAVQVCEEASQEDWAAWAAGAGVNAPSKDSQKLVIELLKGRVK